MITCKTVTPDMRVSNSFVTGYENMSTAYHALRLTYPFITMRTSNCFIMMDEQGTRVILQNHANQGGCNERV